MYLGKIIIFKKLLIPYSLAKGLFLQSQNIFWLWMIHKGLINCKQINQSTYHKCYYFEGIIFVEKWYFRKIYLTLWRAYSLVLFFFFFLLLAHMRSSKLCCCSLKKSILYIPTYILVTLVCSKLYINMVVGEHIFLCGKYLFFNFIIFFVTALNSLFGY